MPFSQAGGARDMFKQGRIFEYKVTVNDPKDTVKKYSTRYYRVDTLYEEGVKLMAGLSLCRRGADGQLVSIKKFPAYVQNKDLMFDAGHLFAIIDTVPRKSNPELIVYGKYSDSIYVGQKYGNEIREYKIPGPHGTPGFQFEYGIYNKKVVSLDSIIVPAGKFYAYGIKYDLSVSSQMASDLKTPITDWYLPGTGFIKRELVDFNKQIITMELVSITDK